MLSKLKNWWAGRPTDQEIADLLRRYAEEEITLGEEEKLNGWVGKGWISSALFDAAKRARARRLSRAPEKTDDTPVFDNSVYHPPYQQTIVTDDPEAGMDEYGNGAATMYRRFNEAADIEAATPITGGAGGLQPRVEEAPAPRAKTPSEQLAERLEAGIREAETAPPPREVVRDQIEHPRYEVSPPPPPPPTTCDYSPPPPPSSDYSGGSSYDSGSSSSGGSFD